MKVWHSTDDHRFCTASLNAAHIYSAVFRSYQARLRKSLGKCTGSKQWWSLFSSLTGCSSKGKPAVPFAAQLADYFSSKLSGSSIQDDPRYWKIAIIHCFDNFELRSLRFDQFCYHLMLVNQLVMMN